MEQTGGQPACISGGERWMVSVVRSGKLSDLWHELRLGTLCKRSRARRMIDLRPLTLTAAF
jgi:hypothetical protein